MGLLHIVLCPPQHSFDSPIAISPTLDSGYNTIVALPHALPLLLQLIHVKFTASRYGVLVLVAEFVIKEACYFQWLIVGVELQDCEILFLSPFIGAEQYLTSGASHGVFEYVVYGFPKVEKILVWLV